MSARLEVICGPMFSGKTTELVRRLREAQGAMAFKPRKDDRYAHDELVTHTRDRYAATPIAAAHDLDAFATPPVIGIDEAHFFGHGLIAPCLRLLSAGKRLIVAGVERDHLGRPFEPFPALLCEADEVLKLSGPCARCGRPAIHSKRMTTDDAPILVGGADIYQPRCRDCFNLP